jgi:hypothetical protein
MNYEQKYKESLERAEKLYEQGTITESLNYIFPELKDSEDERIRKTLIRFHKATIDIDGIKGSEIVSWLEKVEPKSDVWTEKDKTILDGIIHEIEADKDEAPSYDLPTYDKYLNWLETLKKKIKNE